MWEKEVLRIALVWSDALHTILKTLQPLRSFFFHPSSNSVHHKFSASLDGEKSVEFIGFSANLCMF